MPCRAKPTGVALGQALDELSRVGAHDPEAMHIVAELRGSAGGQP